jgi:SAM-dependent methyltransferase
MAANPQEALYDSQLDYTPGSPHLRHRALNRSLLDLTFATIDVATASGLAPEVLEIGGGDGSITEPLLARGLAVISTEMSLSSVERMRARLGSNDHFRAVHDPDGSLSPLVEERFSAILFASVLHHIPDYLTAIGDAVASHLRQGGSLVTIQDPLFYPRLTPTARRASSAAFLSWRLFQGDFVRGLRTRLRRATSGLSEEEVGDAVEYHVVRNGVDERAIVDLLGPLFECVEVHSYWSTQGEIQQRLGQALGLRNTFAITARGFVGADGDASRSA